MTTPMQIVRSQFTDHVVVIGDLGKPASSLFVFTVKAPDRWDFLEFGFESRAKMTFKAVNHHTVTVLTLKRLGDVITALRVSVTDHHPLLDEIALQSCKQHREDRLLVHAMCIESANGQKRDHAGADALPILGFASRPTNTRAIACLAHGLLDFLSRRLGHLPRPVDVPGDGGNAHIRQIGDVMDGQFKSLSSQQKQ